MVYSQLDYVGIAAVCVALGAILKTIFDAWVKRGEQKLEAIKIDVGSDEALRRDMAAQLSMQNVQLGAMQGRLDLVTASAMSWQEKFYEQKCSFDIAVGIMKADNVRLSERVLVFENERSGLLRQVSTLLERIAILEKERDALLARVVLLEQAVETGAGSKETIISVTTSSKDAVPK